MWDLKGKVHKTKIYIINKKHNKTLQCNIWFKIRKEKNGMKGLSAVTFDTYWYIQQILLLEIKFLREIFVWYTTNSRNIGNLSLTHVSHLATLYFISECTTWNNCPPVPSVFPKILNYNIVANCYIKLVLLLAFMPFH